MGIIVEYLVKFDVIVRRFKRGVDKKWCEVGKIFIVYLIIVYYRIVSWVIIYILYLYVFIL